ncbi:MAG: Asp-tRNA(Asn)/Glu-tRNA(Gln) amidotransferase subunit GatC [Clostridia bacterium]|nr:Asp-tRNA(Asn)/Glu-tRNA(Gln) amidotransferase subunit GatC [Clostridia bacterium]
MSISKEEVLKIEKLSRINFNDDQLEKQILDLSNIVEFANQLEEIDVSQVKPTAHILDIQNRLREDKEEPCFSREEILKNAPSAQGGCISVPKVIE